MKQNRANNRKSSRIMVLQAMISAVILLCVIIVLSDKSFPNTAETESMTVSTQYESQMQQAMQAETEHNELLLVSEGISEDTYNDIQDIEISVSGKNTERFMENITDNDINESNTEIDGNYFNQTLFIGDSLTVGLQLYGGISNADYFCITGIGVDGIRRSEMNGIMLDTRLDLTQYKTIYIMLGINDIGINREKYLSSYRSLLDYIHEKQPDANIIIQSILVVTESYTNQNPMFNNDEVRARNDALSEMADYDHIFYLELNDYFMDSNGNLFDNMSSDGCHLLAASYSIWRDVLINHEYLY